ncbi:ferritin-like domain-containing protein [Phreatobacter oligotrophus]|uniref:Ferritin-like metal-binding protein YciE n=2 Tax=Phreatobacter oligotrophus TaxID=1122261 RepID=A0A2T4YWY3_9HYPH|nr:ferritin-like domain-containing protein [Phreatobacter oligotrophus]PTM49830.1 ferritin-like metal-binding protein YciE [Phreatobacter oligotrophus]
MAKTKTLEDMFVDGLKDILFAERQILRTLPKMARAAQSQELKAAIEKHKDQTEGQIERLEKVFEQMEVAARGKTCPAILGIIEEGQEVLEEFKGSPALDAGIVASAQAVEHYEIARYGTLKAWADRLGEKDAARLLAETLAEEEQTDADLTKLAKGSINRQATAEAA